MAAAESEERDQAARARARSAAFTDARREAAVADPAPGAAADNHHQALYVGRRALESAGADAGALLPLRDDMLCSAPAGVEIDIEPSRRRSPAPADRRGAESARRSSSTAASCSRRTATSRGPPAGARRCTSRTSRCCSSSPAVLPRRGRPRRRSRLLQQVVVADPLHEAAHRGSCGCSPRPAAASRRSPSTTRCVERPAPRGWGGQPDPQTGRLTGRCCARPARPAKRWPTRSRALAPHAPAIGVSAAAVAALAGLAAQQRRAPSHTVRSTASAARSVAQVVGAGRAPAGGAPRRERSAHGAQWWARLVAARPRQSACGPSIAAVVPLGEQLGQLEQQRHVGLRGAPQRRAVVHGWSQSSGKSSSAPSERERAWYPQSSCRARSPPPSQTLQHEPRPRR